jgi:hypothetical protein
MMCFHIPFTIGIFKVFVTTTPTDGGSIMRVRTWIDGRTNNNYLYKCIAWLLSGISASQMITDIDIMENKIRLKKPLLQPFDGPYNRTNAWLKLFYSESSNNFNTAGKCEAYKNDW